MEHTYNCNLNATFYNECIYLISEETPLLKKFLKNEFLLSIANLFFGLHCYYLNKMKIKKKYFIIKLAFLSDLLIIQFKFYLYEF